jgi:ribosomal protein L11 methylase PrmA
MPPGLSFPTEQLLAAASTPPRSCFCGRLDDASVLDLGTGSGVLALAARVFGARTISAIDFDANAITTARRNESLNFRSRRVHWEVADVKRLGALPRYLLVVANLFSGILVEAAPRIARVLQPGGELWLSGVLPAGGSCRRLSGFRLAARKDDDARQMGDATLVAPGLTRPRSASAD